MNDKLLPFGIGLGVGLIISLIYNGVELYKIHEKQLDLRHEIKKLKIDIDHLERMIDLEKILNDKLLETDEDLKNFLEGVDDFKKEFDDLAKSTETNILETKSTQANIEKILSKLDS